MVKYILLLSIVWTCSSFAAKENIPYLFRAYNSYKSESGKCVKSIFEVAMITDKLIVKATNLPAEIITLTPDQVEQITYLAQREAGEYREVTIPFLMGTSIKLIGDTCGDRYLCDEVQILVGSKVLTYSQPLEGIPDKDKSKPYCK